jgi:hypothetical protein
MAVIEHATLDAGNIHKAHNWEYADAAARVAATGFAADDVDKLALQASDGTYWRLTDDSPITWAQVTYATGTAAGTVATGNHTHTGVYAAAAHAHTSADVSDFAEAVRDRVGSTLVAGSNVTITVDDPGDTITIAASGGGGAALTVQEVDGTPSDAAVTVIRFPNGSVTDNGAGDVTIAFPGGATMTVEEVDGTPSVAANEIIFPNGTLTDNGGGSVTYTPSGGGGGDSSHTAAYASRPAASNAGDLFLPSDGAVVERDTGAAWVPWGPLYPLTEPPAVASFGWVNQGGSTATKEKGGLYLAGANSGGTGVHAVRALTKAAPATPYTVTLAWLPNYPISLTNCFAGLVWRQSSDGKLCAFWVGRTTAGALQLLVSKYTNASTLSANYTSITEQHLAFGGVIWLQFSDDGTNRVCRWGTDGQHWQDFHSVGRTDFLTADEVGFCGNLMATAGSVGLNVISWRES